VSKTDSSGTTTYLFDGDRVLADSRADYTNGGATGLISERAGSTTKFYHGDQLGSTRGITDSSQAISDSREYDSFGLTIASTGSAATPFKFVGGEGYQADADSGLMLLGERYYDPSVGRFINRDPIGYPGGLNLYVYVESNPIELVDPDGRDPTLGQRILAGIYAFIIRTGWISIGGGGLGGMPKKPPVPVERGEIPAAHIGRGPEPWPPELPPGLRRGPLPTKPVAPVTEPWREIPTGRGPIGTPSQGYRPPNFPRARGNGGYGSGGAVVGVMATLYEGSDALADGARGTISWRTRIDDYMNPDGDWEQSTGGAPRIRPY
jgi:RHS repeat-associated protein